MADSHGGGGMAAEDYQEEEVWAMMKAREGSKIRKNFSTSSSWQFAAVSRAIPTSATSSGGASSSAPLIIADWSKVLKKKPKKKNMWDDDACHDGDDGRDFHRTNNIDDDDDDDFDEMLPPHEYLAKRLASTQIASFSMCEGVGRTLKGRDLSNLRNAILTKTGFLEQS